MPTAAFAQTSFLGGEWSKNSQGRLDDKRYKTSMNVCLNSYPLEEGAWTRRPGFQYAAHTRGGVAGKLVKFDFTQNDPYNIEFTDGHLRFFTGINLVTENTVYVVEEITTDSPAIMTTTDETDWEDGDHIFFTAVDDTTAFTLIHIVNRVFEIVALDVDEFELRDAVTGLPIDGSQVGWTTGLDLTVAKVHDLESPYEDGDWSLVNSVQSLDFQQNQHRNIALLLHGGYQPHVLTMESAPTEGSGEDEGTYATFSIDAALLLDGPYLDPVTGSTMAPSATAGIITVTLGFTAYVAGKAYKAGDFVTSVGIGYRSLQDANVGNTPASSPLFWEPASPGDAVGPEGFVETDIGRLVRMHSGNSSWTWGRITGMTTTGLISASLPGSLNIGNMTAGGGLAAAFDSDVTQTSGVGAVRVFTSPGAISSYVGKNYSGASAQTISSVVVVPSTDLGFSQGTVSSITINLRAKATVPANAADGTLLGTSGAFTDTTLPKTISSNDLSTTWNYVWVELKTTLSSATGGLLVAEASFYSATGFSGSAATVEVLGPSLANTSTMTTWRLGRYSDTSGWPTAGTYHQGRLWLADGLGNHLDGSVSNDPFNFEPTAAAGTVADNNAISYTFNSSDINVIHWLTPTSEGIVLGTSGGEWLVKATEANGILTPTSIQAHRYTTYRCANVQPVNAGMSTIFVQKAKMRLHEYLTDAYGKFFAPNLSRDAKHLTASSIEEIAYQEEKTPIIWARTGDGGLIGCTYRRISRFSTEDPIFFGWHRHTMGSGRLIESICVGPSIEGGLDTLAVITNDIATGIRHVELMTTLPDEDAGLLGSFHLDNATVPEAANTVTVAGIQYVRFHGLHHLVGRIVQVFAAGLDCGNHMVEDGGYVDIQYGGDQQPLFTLSYLQNVTTSGEDFGELETEVDESALTFPCVIGFTYTSQGQLLRPASSADTGAREGPGIFKPKRAHEVGIILQGTQGISFGTRFDRLRTGLFRTPGNRAYEEDQLFSGIHWAILNDDYSYDSQLCWQIVRPYPATIAAIGGTLSTQG